MLGRGNAVDERRQVGDAADGLDLFAAVEFFGERDHVDGRPVSCRSRMREKMRRCPSREKSSGLSSAAVEEQAVEQDGAEDGALGFDGGESALRVYSVVAIGTGLIRLAREGGARDDD